MAYPVRLLALFAAIFVALGIGPADRKLWLAESALTLTFVAAVVLTHHAYRLRDRDYTLAFVFLVLHTVGSHYTYDNVPYDRWWAALFGRGFNETFSLSRNHYDRLVHFAFGALLVEPIRAFLARHARPARPVDAWPRVMAVGAIAAAGGLFEVFEWVAAATFGRSAGTEYVAMQGDPWDAQKDMALAFAGAVAVAFVAARVAARAAATATATAGQQLETTTRRLEITPRRWPPTTQ